MAYPMAPQRVFLGLYKDVAAVHTHGVVYSDIKEMARRGLSRQVDDRMEPNQPLAHKPRSSEVDLVGLLRRQWVVVVVWV